MFDLVPLFFNAAVAFPRGDFYWYVTGGQIDLYDEVSCFPVLFDLMMALQSREGLPQGHKGLIVIKSRGQIRDPGQTQYIFEKSKNILNLGHLIPQKYTQPKNILNLGQF